jgi:iron complex outermembrane receptor protein
MPLLAVVFAAPAAYAGDGGTVKLKEVVVTALRSEERTDRIPANVTVITREDIEKSTARTVQDLLRGQEGLIVRDLYGTGSKSTVDMRGFARGLNTAVLIDGRKVNEIDLSGVDWNQIPLENVERIEIVRGSGSVLYGDNAMAGAINIITRKGKGLRPSVSAEVRGESYSGHAEELSLRGTGGPEGRLGYFLFGKFRETDGYRENSEFRAKDLKSNLSFDLTDYLSLGVRGGWHQDHQGLAGGLTESEIQADRRQSVKPDDGVDTEQYFYAVRGAYSRGPEELAAEWSFNNREFDSKAVFTGTSFDTDRSTDTGELTLKLTSRRDILGHRNLVVAGFDYQSADVDNKTSFMGSDTLSTIEKTERGYYVEDEFSLTDKWIATAGYRYTDADYGDVVKGFTTGSGSDEFTEDALSAGVAYNYAPGSKLYVSYSKGFRLPTTDELFSFDGTIVSLKPERSDTYEAGLVSSLGESLQARLAVYRMDIENELIFNPSTFSNENLDDTRHSGAEAALRWDLGDYVSLNGSYTYTEATFRSGPNSGNTVPLIPTHSASVGGELTYGGFLLALNGNWVGKRFLENDLENSMEELGDYTTVDAKLSYSYGALLAYVGVNNIFNEKYNELGVVGSTRTEFYPAPERNYYAGMRLTF